MFGLTLGLACCALVILFVRHELRYDTFHPRHQDIYRLIYEYSSQAYTVTGFLNWWDTSPQDQLIKPEAFRQIPEVEEVAQFNVTYGETMGDHPIFVEIEKPGDMPERFSEKQVLITNTGRELFHIFGWKFLEGNPLEACSEFYTAILTEETARKYYGKNWPEKIRLEKTIYWEEQAYRITGVIEDIPAHAHYDFDLILYKPTIPSWCAYTYLLLHPDAETQAVNNKINEVLIDLEPTIADNPLQETSYLQPLKDIHLNSNYLYELKPPGDIRYLYVFSIIGLIILLITCTNYINLSVAMYAGRHQEIGMRKVLGAHKKNILGQFLTEAILLTLLCLPLALILLQCILPVFNQLMNLKLKNDFLTSLSMFGLLTATAFGVGVLSGLYPAWILARKQVVRLFKEGISRRGEGLLVQRGLIIFQFTLLISLSSATFFINQQLRYINNKDVGFNKDGVISFNPVSIENFHRIKNKLQSYPQIKAIGAGILPGMRASSQVTYQLEGSADRFIDGSLWHMDYGTVRALGLHSDLLTQIEEEKRDFNEILLINEAAAKVLSTVAGVSKEELIGMTVNTNLEYESESGEGYGDRYTISGFVKDVHLHSLKQKINPLFIRITKEPDWLYHAILKIETKHLSETTRLIEKVYYEEVDGLPFEIHFLEDQLRKLYEQEQRVSNLTTYLSIVAVVLAILGLIGLTAYLTKLRIKEIGIRKVMGASIGQILLLLNREFILLVIVSTVIAAPIAYLAINEWLADFAYRITINVIIFIFIGFIAFLVSVTVVTIQSIKAAKANPVQTLHRDA